jgi:hypothetical protein
MLCFVDLVLQSFHPVQSNDDNVMLYKVLVPTYALYTVLREQMELIFANSWSFKLMALNFPGVNKQE